MTPAPPLVPDKRIPPPVLAWGLAGLIPFLGLPLIGVAFPSLSIWTDRALGLYAAVILSFLGGARWGRAVAEASPDSGLVALSMAPSVTAWALLILPPGLSVLQLLAMAGALGLHLVWDLRASGLPVWYPRLRLILTAGAVAGLAAGALT